MAPGKRIKAGLFNQIKANALAEFDITGKSFDVAKRTIFSRVARNNLVVSKLGRKSPMEYAERVILAFVMMKQEAGQPIKVGELLELGNSVVQDHVMKFQKSINKPQTGILSRGWVRGFYRRHQEMLTQAKGYHLNGMRMDDLTQDNIEVMYDLTY